MNDENDGTPTTDWEEFLFTLPPPWRPAALAFDESGIVEGRHDSDGSWTLDVLYGLSDVRRLLRDAPVGFAPVRTGQNWWDQNLEREGGIFVAKDGRAFLSWSDCFGAGMNARLCVCSTDESFRTALAEAECRHAETYEDDDEQNEPAG